MLQPLKCRCEPAGKLLFVSVLSLSMALTACGGGVGGDDDTGARTGEESGRSSRVTVESSPSVETIEKTAAGPVSVEQAETVAQGLGQSTDGQVRSEVTYEEAETAFFEKRYGEALEMFTQYTQRKPENPWGHYMKGLSAWKDGELDTARQAFERALELDPLHVKSWINLSRVLLDGGKPGDALAGINEALAIDPGSNAAIRLRGRACHQLGRLEEAEEAYRQAIRIDDQDAWSMNNLGLLLIEEERFDEALPPLARAVQLRDDIAVFRNNLGMALEHTGHFLAARDVYRAAIDIDKSSEKASLNYSRVEGVIEDPGLLPVNIENLAAIFMDEIEMRTGAETSVEQPGKLGSDANSIVFSEADSTEIN